MQENLLILSDARGVYIPRDFSEIYGDVFSYEGLSNGYTYQDALNVITQGPTQEWYWEAWDAILQSARHERYPHLVLYQDGDVFLCTNEFIEENFSL